MSLTAATQRHTLHENTIDSAVHSTGPPSFSQTSIEKVVYKPMSHSGVGQPNEIRKPEEPVKPSPTGKSNDTEKDLKWCCEVCTFQSEGESCQMCGAPKPV